jgi:hypothetical protein
MRGYTRTKQRDIVGGKNYKTLKGKGDIYEILIVV